MSTIRSKKPIKKAIFPVGGLGTRFLPATKSLPKEMLPVVDKPLIHYAFEEARAAGIEQFIFITGRNKNAISNHFDHSYELQRILDDQDKTRELAMTRDWLPEAGSVFFTRQQEALGLGHAVWCARHFIKDEPFAVLLADDMVLSNTPCLKQMVEAYNDAPPDSPASNVVAVMDVPREKTSSYGIVDIDGAHSANPALIKAKGLVEKPKPEVAPSTLSIIGRYILQPEVFDFLDKKQKGAGGEIQLTDAIASMIGTSGVYGYRFEGTRFDCGNQLGFIEANIAYALARPDIGHAVQDMLVRYGNVAHSKKA